MWMEALLSIQQIRPFARDIGCTWAKGRPGVSDLEAIQAERGMATPILRAASCRVEKALPAHD